MDAERLSGVTHPGCREILVVAFADLAHDPPDRRRRTRGAPLARRDLVNVHDSAKAGFRVHEGASCIDHGPRSSRRRPQAVHDEGGSVKRRGFRVPLVRLEVFPADEPDAVAALDADLAQNRDQVGSSRPILSHQAHRLAEHHLDIGQPGERRIAVTFVADDENAAATCAGQEHRFLKARLEARQEGDIGHVLAVGVDRQPIATGLGVSGGAAGLVDVGRNPGLFERHPKVGNLDGPQADGHSCSSATRFG